MEDKEESVPRLVIQYLEVEWLLGAISESETEQELEDSINMRDNYKHLLCHNGYAVTNHDEVFQFTENLISKRRENGFVRTN